MDIATIKGYILDLDGTVYLGDRLIPGAKETIDRLRKAGKQVTFLSNKPIQPREAYAEKLRRLGINVDVSDVINSSWAMAQFLSKRAPGARIYPIGEPPFIRELEAAGLIVADRPEAVEYVIAAFDRTFDYAKLNFGFQAIKRGAHLIATNADRACPTEDGEIPDAAGIIAALEATTGKSCECVVGKPSPIMLQVILDQTGLQPEDCMIVGDRLETDIKMGIEAGMSTALVLTGVTTREMLHRADIHPDYVLDSIAQLNDL